MRDKKERMLDYITSNVKWFMTTEASVEVIPFYNLSPADFNRAKNYFANDADYDEVVCLISTSVMSIGKSGILFTTDYVYSKAWGGILTGSYKNWIFSSYTARFGTINEFDEDRMRELMSDLADIACDVDDDQEESNISEALQSLGKIIGGVTLGGMAIAEIGSLFSDYIVDANSELIQKELENIDEDSVNGMGLKVYEGISQESSQLVGLLNKCDDEDVDDNTAWEIINALNNVLISLYNQIIEHKDIDEDDDEAYIEYLSRIDFWALLFNDADQFREKYSTAILNDVPDLWDGIMELVDLILEDEEWKPSFSEIVYEFADHVSDNLENLYELIQTYESEDEYEEQVQEIIDSNNEYVCKLLDALDQATDYISSFLEE